jgi:hypothetical protein
MGPASLRGIESWWAPVKPQHQTHLPKELSSSQAWLHSHTASAAGVLWQLLVLTRLYPCFVSYLRFHYGNAWTDNLVSGLALGLRMETAAPVEASLLSHAVYHENASALGRQFISMPPHMLVRPLSMSLLIVWLCGV